MNTTLAKLCFAICLLVPAGSTFGASPEHSSTAAMQIAAFDEWDVVRFYLGMGGVGSAAFGALRWSMKLPEFFEKTPPGIASQGWAFEGNVLHLKAGPVLSLVSHGE